MPFRLSTTLWSGGFFNSYFCLLRVGAGVGVSVQISPIYFFPLLPVVGAILLLKTPLLIKRRNRSSSYHITRAISEQGTHVCYMVTEDGMSLFCKF